MRILTVMLYWYPYEGPLMPIYGAIFEDLVAKGHQVSLVTSFPHFRRGRTENWEEYRGKLYEVSNWKGIKLLRSYVFAPVSRSERLSIIYRALNFLSFSLSSVFAGILLGGKCDIILAPSIPPLSNGISAWLISLFKHCPMVYNVQDLYPDIAVKMNVIRNLYILAFLKKVEKLVYRLSSKVLTISDGMKAAITRKGVPPDKVEVIENFIDTDFIRPGERNNFFSKKYGLNRAFIVMYAGTIGIPHGVEVLIKAAEILKSDPGIIFCFVVRGEYRERIQELSREKGLQNTVFIEQQPQEMVPLIWATASVGVITYRKGLSDFSLPSKLLAMMCAARPVIASADEGSDTVRLIRKAKCGICVEPESPQALADAILELKADQKQLEYLGQQGRRYSLGHFKRNVISSRYETFFQKLISMRSQN